MRNVPPKAATGVIGILRMSLRSKAGADRRWRGVERLPAPHQLGSCLQSSAALRIHEPLALRLCALPIPVIPPHASLRSRNRAGETPPATPRCGCLAPGILGMVA